MTEPLTLSLYLKYVGKYNLMWGNDQELDLVNCLMSNVKILSGR